MKSVFNAELEEESSLLTPQQMREVLRCAVEVRPEDIYGAGLPKGHIAAVLAGKVDPLPELLAALGLQPIPGGYASAIPEEPQPLYTPCWPDGQPLTLADEGTVLECVREAYGAAVAVGDCELSGYADLVRVLLHGMVAEGAMPNVHSHDAEHSALAFRAGALWERRREEPGVTA